MKKANLLALILLLFSVASAQPKKSKFDPSKLLTQAEAQAILGKPVKRAPKSTGLSSAVMIQYLEDSERLMTENLAVQVHYGSASEFSRYIKSMRTDLGLTPKPVPGIGVKAFYAEGQLVVRQGRHLFIVMFGSNRPDAERLKVATAVAKKVLPRLAKV